MHTDLIERYGGSQGVFDDGLVESALPRPKSLLKYKPKSDLAALAASLAFGIAKNHGVSRRQQAHGVRLGRRVPPTQRRAAYRG